MSKPVHQKTTRADFETRRATRAQRKTWCFTSYVTKHYSYYKNELSLHQSGIRYMVYQLEKCPTTDRLHLQGYVEFYKDKRMTQVKRILENNALHLEARRGTRKQARDYCCDEDKRLPNTEAVFLGKFRTRQGHRTDVDQIADCVIDGWSASQIAAEFPSIYMRMHRGIAALITKRDEATLNQYHKIDTTVVFGKSRAGKTRFIFDKHGAENVYVAQITEDRKLWFQGYEGQKVLLINEFYGQLPVNYMQNLLDNYRMQLQVKGGHAVSNWDHIYITANCDPIEWYSGWRRIPEAVMESIFRRFDEIVHLPPPPRKKFDIAALYRRRGPDGKIRKAVSKAYRLFREERAEVDEALVLPSSTSTTTPSGVETVYGVRRTPFESKYFKRIEPAPDLVRGTPCRIVAGPAVGKSHSGD